MQDIADIFLKKSSVLNQNLTLRHWLLITNKKIFGKIESVYLKNSHKFTRNSDMEKSLDIFNSHLKSDVLKRYSFNTVFYLSDYI